MKDLYQNNMGLTLVEVVTALGFFSILIIVAIPSFSDLSQKTRFNAEVQRLFTSLHHAKITAIKKNSFVVLKVGDHSFETFLDDGNGNGVAGDWQRQSDEALLVRHSFAKGIQLTSNFSLDRTRFSGRPGGKAGTITLQDPSGSKKAVVISLTGNIRIAQG